MLVEPFPFFIVDSYFFNGFCLVFVCQAATKKIFCETPAKYLFYFIFSSRIVVSEIITCGIMRLSAQNSKRRDAGADEPSAIFATCECAIFFEYLGNKLKYDFWIDELPALYLKIIILLTLWFVCTCNRSHAMSIFCVQIAGRSVLNNFVGIESIWKVYVNTSVCVFISWENWLTNTMIILHMENCKKFIIDLRFFL